MKKNSRNRPYRGYISEVQSLQQGFRNEPERNHVVLQHGLPAPETVPGVQEKKEGGKRACMKFHGSALLLY